MMSISRRVVEFTFLLLFTILSIICTIYFTYHLIKKPTFRKRVQNQTLIIIVFLVSLNTILNIPTVYSYYARGYVSPESEIFCYMWGTIDYIFTSCIIWCKAMYTLERYILVFHPNRFRSNREKLIFHHIPLIIIILYLILFYTFTAVFYDCHRNLEYDRILCGEQCLDQEGRLPQFNWVFHISFPVFVIVFGSVFILVRVLWKRREMQRNLRNWSKNWKMIIQLLGIAMVYTIVWLPLVIFALIISSSKAGSQSHIEDIEERWYYMTYLCELTVPIVALFLSPEILPKLHRHFRPGTMRIGTLTGGTHSTN